MPIRLAVAAALLIAGFAQAGDAVHIQVLGIAQDAGYPQAGCYRPHCLRAWRDPSLRRKASSIAVIDEGGASKYLFDATPDLREQLFALHQVAPDTVYSLAGVFLTHAHIGHYTGLMHFGHEASGATDVPVYAMPRMREYLSSNGPWDQLVRYRNIRLEDLGDGVPVKLGERLTVTPFLVPHRDEYSETVGFRIEGPNRTAVFIPDVDKWRLWATDLAELVRGVDFALIDATFYADGELPGRDMSKVRHPFVTESMALLDALRPEERARVIFIHMNHTNPLLETGSPEQVEVARRGFRVADEGMRLEL